MKRVVSESESRWSSLVASTLANLPLAPLDHVRLYRIESSGSSVCLAPWLSEALADTGAREAAGRWFTSDPQALAFYAEDAPFSPQLVYGDVPISLAETWCVASFVKQGKIDPQRYSRAPSNEFFVSSEWADTLIRYPLESPLPKHRPRF